MGLLDSLTNAAQSFGGGDTAKVAGGLMETVQSQPGGLTGLTQNFQQNGLGGLLQRWTGGQTAPASQDEVQQGVGSGVIDSVAQRTGLSPTAVKAGLAVLLPVLIHHMAESGHIDQQGQPTGQPVQDHTGLLQSVLGRLL